VLTITGFPHKGFNVQDLFAPYDVTINIPTFFWKKNRMTVLKDRAISSKRVHIERIIGLAKTYKILKEPLNVTETKLASEITFVCFMIFINMVKKLQEFYEKYFKSAVLQRLFYKEYSKYSFE
jgi:hypothetical protein